ENSQVNVEGMRSLLNVSAIASRANRPRRFTQAPRLVETVTSGEVVTMRAAYSPWSRPISLRIAPKPACVDITGWIETGSSSGTGVRRGLRFTARGANGLRMREAGRLGGLNQGPLEAVPSMPALTFMAARNASICAGVISPA